MRDIITNVRRYSYKVPVILITFQWNLSFLEKFEKNPQVKTFMKIRPVESVFFSADRQTWQSRYSFSAFKQKRLKRSGTFNQNLHRGENCIVLKIPRDINYCTYENEAQDTEAEPKCFKEEWKAKRRINMTKLPTGRKNFIVCYRVFMYATCDKTFIPTARQSFLSYNMAHSRTLETLTGVLLIKKFHIFCVNRALLFFVWSSYRNPSSASLTQSTWHDTSWY